MVVLSDFQTFHAPSLGEEDFKFEIPAITFPTSNTEVSDCGGSTQSPSPTCISSPGPEHYSPNPSNNNNISCNNNNNNSGYNTTQPLSHPSTDFLTDVGSRYTHTSLSGSVVNNNNTYSLACNGGVHRPPPAYPSPIPHHVPLHIIPPHQQQQHLQQQQHPPQHIYHGSVHVQSSYQVYPQHPQYHPHHPHHNPRPQYYHPNGAPATNLGLHYYQNGGPGGAQTNLNLNSHNNQQQQQQQPTNSPLGYYGPIQNLPQFSQFIPPQLQMMQNQQQQQQQREPILMTMDKQQQQMGQQGQGGPPQPMAFQAPAGSSPSTITSRDSSDSSDDAPLAQLTLKRPAATTVTKPAAKKARTTGSKKKKKKDPNEPQKPVSAYALFFRDTQAAIKNQNASATFGEVSKIVASMWDSLDEDTKSAYKKRTEVAKKEYLKQLAAYRASLVSQGAEGSDFDKSPTISPERTVLPSPQHDGNSSATTSTAGPGTVTIVVSSAVAVSAPQASSTLVASSTTSSSSVNMQQQQGQGSTPLSHMPATCSVSSSPQHQQQFQQQQQQGPPHHHMQQQGMEPNAFYGNQQPPPQMMQQLQSGPGGAVSHMPGGPGGDPSGGMCVRHGCEQPAVTSPQWDQEYCSNDCVVDHCRDVFTAWVAQRQAPGGSSTYASVK